MKKKLLFILIGIYFLSFISGTQTNSSNYAIDIVASSGGGVVNSTNYQTDVIIGTVTGKTNSSSYQNNLGFFHGAGAIIVPEVVVPVAPPSSGGSSSGGGGGGGGAPSTEISLSPEEINLNLITNTNNEQFIEVTNLENREIKLKVSQRDLDKMVILENDEIILAKGETKKFSVIFVALNDTGVFTGKILIGNKKVLVSLNVKTKFLLFDSNIIVLNKNYQVNQGDKLNTKITLIPMGDPERLDVTLNYVIKDYTNKTYLTHSETLLVTEQMEIERDFGTGALPLGEYVIGLELVYPNGVAPSSAHFTIIKEDSKIVFYTIIVILSILILIILALIIREFVKRRSIQNRPQ